MRVLVMVPALPKHENDPDCCLLWQDIKTIADERLEVAVLCPEPADLSHRRVRVYTVDDGSTGTVSRVFGLARAVLYHKRPPALSRKDIWRFAFSWEVQRRVGQIRSEFRPDVVHSHFAWPQGLGADPFSRRTGLPHVMTLRGGDVNVEKRLGYGARLSPFVDRNTRRALRGAAAVTVASRAMMAKVCELGADPEKTFIIPNGVDTKTFSPQEDAALCADSSKNDRPVVIGSAGHLIPLKGFDLLIKAAALLRQRGFNLRVEIAGEGHELLSLSRLAKEMRVSDHLVFRGAIAPPEMPNFMRRLDIFALCSRQEGFGNVLIEASATARPVVGSQVGGIPDIIEDGVTGLLFPKDNVAALASRLATLSASKELRNRMGRGGRRRVVERFSMKARGKAFRRLYNSVTGGTS